MYKIQQRCFFICLLASFLGSNLGFLSLTRRSGIAKNVIRLYSSSDMSPRQRKLMEEAEKIRREIENDAAARERGEEVKETNKIFVANTPTVVVDVVEAKKLSMAERDVINRDKAMANLLVDKVDSAAQRESLLNKITGEETRGKFKQQQQAESSNKMEGAIRAVEAVENHVSPEASAVSSTLGENFKSQIPAAQTFVDDFPSLDSLKKDFQPKFVGWMFFPLLHSFAESQTDFTDEERLLYEKALVLEAQAIIEDITMNEQLNVSEIDFLADPELIQQRGLARFELMKAKCTISSSSSSSIAANEPARIIASDIVATQLLKECQKLRNKLQMLQSGPTLSEVERAELLAETIQLLQVNEQLLLRLSSERIESTESTVNVAETTTITSMGGGKEEEASPSIEEIEAELLTDGKWNRLVDFASNFFTDGSEKAVSELRSNMTNMIATTKKEDEGLFSFLEKAVQMSDDEHGRDSAKTGAERFIKTYWDVTSLKSGKALSRDGAGIFQKDILRDLFVVNSVRMVDGAVIFDGKPLSGGSKELAEKLEEKFSKSELKDTMGYTILLDEQLPNLDGGLQQAAIDMLLGSSPAVVVFPKSWNSTINAVVNDPSRRLWRSLLNTASIVTTGVYAGSCVNLFDPEGSFATTGIVPDDFLALAFMPLFIQLLSSFAEMFSARLKGFEVSSVLVPTLSTFNFGIRSIYTTMPKSRNDMFDVAALQIGSSLLSSLALLLYGLSLTSSAAKETLSTFPTISISLLQSNNIVGQLLRNKFPEVFLNLSPVADTTVHLHWLAIVGASTFIASLLQLLPLDNSSGSKMSFAVLGRDNFELLTALASFVKFFFIVPYFFGFGPPATPFFDKPRIFLDYILSSQIAASSSENQVAIDNLSEVSEGRKIGFVFFCALLFAAFFPFVTVSQQASELMDKVTSLASSQALF